MSAVEGDAARSVRLETDGGGREDPSHAPSASIHSSHLPLMGVARLNTHTHAHTHTHTHTYTHTHLYTHINTHTHTH